MSRSSAHILLHTLGGNLDAFLCPRGESTNADMVVEVWQRLPVELFLAILPSLPPRSLARFRAVSKRVKRTINSDQFRRHLKLRQQKGAPAGIPMCGIEYFHGGTIPDPGYFDPTKQVIKVDLEFLPQEYRNCVHFVAQDGLICVWRYRTNARSGYRYRDWSFCVFSPLTGQYKVLPPRSHYWESCREILKVCIRVIEPGDGLLPSKFVVLVASCSASGNGRVYVAAYLSSTNLWQHVVEHDYNEGGGDELHHLVPHYLQPGSQIVSAYDGMRHGMNDSYSRYSLDAEGRVDRAYRNLYVPENVLADFDPLLVEYCGHLFTIQGAEDNSYVRDRRQRLWTLTILRLDASYEPPAGSHLNPGIRDLWKDFATTQFQIPDSMNFPETLRIASTPETGDDSDSEFNDDIMYDETTYPPDHELHYRVEGALVVGDAIYVNVTMWRPDPSDQFKPLAIIRHILSYNLQAVEPTFEIIDLHLRHQSCIGRFQLFMPRL